MVHRILFVDDEPLITQSLKRGLINESYECYFANSGKQALALLKQQEMSVLVTDMKMPEMSGLELLKIVKNKYPQMIRIILSGYTQLPQVLVSVNQGEIFKFITKPWNLEDELKFVLREAVDYYDFKKTQEASRISLEQKNETYQNILKKYDDVVLDIKKEISYIKQLNNKSFKKTQKLLNQWSGQKSSLPLLNQQITMHHDIISWFLEIIPIGTQRFSMEKLVNMFHELIEEHNIITVYSLTLDKEIQPSYVGKMSVILLLLKIIVLKIIGNQINTEVKVNIINDSVDGEYRIIWLMDAPISNINYGKEIVDVVDYMRSIDHEERYHFTMTRGEPGRMMLRLIITLDL